ncbi:MAG TPA: hypothetical protein VGD03_08705 [Frankiaceae bacterium]
MKKTRYAGIVGLGLAVSLGAAACGSSTSSSTTAAGSSSSTAATPTPLAAVATLSGKQTAVTLNMSTIGALKSLGVTVGGFGTASNVTLSDGAAVAFPITGGHVTVYPPHSIQPYVQGSIDHKGSGLTFTAGGKTLTASDFVVDPGTSMLTATINGASTPLFFLDGSNLTISGPTSGAYMLDGTVVKLLPAAARALESYFGAPANAIPDYAPVGVAHITATGS